jgi:hypothetical protein
MSSTSENDNKDASSIYSEITVKLFDKYYTKVLLSFANKLSSEDNMKDLLTKLVD